MPSDLKMQILRELTTAVLALIQMLCLAQVLSGYSSPASAATSNMSISHLCDRAAFDAAKANDIPMDVLRAISRTETGRAGEFGLQPWPWTVNMEGTGLWFATEDEARAYVFDHFKRGARSFDVGCFQINYKWHGAAFRSIDDMFDPILNARYAATFLKELYQEFGNWSDAAGAFHSRTPVYARRYAARFDSILGQLDQNAGNAVLPVAARQARAIALVPKPLLRGGSLAMGSLVPIARSTVGASRRFVEID